ncbi:MAG: heavy metal translocating P-type ATPase metal-binding domain-containing protein [Verrucomicrobiae bacterium]|nr:heavy metal translocating P-type ATPase metal-binding domain-containing protein [Verrucomicrobiae bacterium]
MASCEHCGTEFSPRRDDERYCCKGCEYVAVMIAEQGFEKFYDLKQGLAVAPVRSRPFEQHDFRWLDAKLAAAEKKAGESASAAHLDLGIEGISCVGCVWLIERLFTRHPGGIRAAANPASGRMHLEWVPGKCDLRPFLEELCQFGYVAAPVPGGGEHERRRLAARLGLCGAFALNTMGFSLPRYLGMPDDFEFAGLFRLIAFLSATLSMLVGGGYFIDRAWRALKAGSLHIDLPIALGLVAAYAGSIVGWALGSERLMYFDFVSIFVFLMLAGRMLQTSAVERNRRRLVRTQPVPVSVPVPDGRSHLAREDIEPGTRFLLEPGQALPTSGILLSKNADFSLEWIHGEADPVSFTTSSRLPAGAILLSREAVEIEAEETWESSLLAKLTAASTAERDSPGLDRLLRVYLLCVLALGLIALAWWSLHNAWLTGLQAMVSVFVVSCPCALGVAVPLADDLAAGAMERIGVFVRSSAIWSRLRRIRRVVFDKTGTLTLERPLLLNTGDVDALDDDAALALVVLTRDSLHPAARSLHEALGTRGRKLLDRHGPAEILETPGQGVRWETPVGAWSLGRAGWMAEPPTETGPGSELRHKGRLIARFQFQESLRPGAVETLQELTERGFQPEILSGDHPERVAELAGKLGIPPSHAAGGLSPEEKAARLRKLDRGDTLYLGDGANDSLAFDVAMVTGTPVVDRSLLESKADFYTLGSGLAFLPGLFRAAAARSRAVRSAFSFALVYNVTTVAISMAGHMNPLLAAVLMPISSLVSIAIVAMNSPRSGAIRG